MQRLRGSHSVVFEERLRPIRAMAKGLGWKWSILFSGGQHLSEGWGLQEVLDEKKVETGSFG